jgi:hypothetical protein
MKSMCGAETARIDDQGGYSKPWPHWSKHLLPDFSDLIAMEEVQLRVLPARCGERPVRLQLALHINGKWIDILIVDQGTPKG